MCGYVFAGCRKRFLFLLAVSSVSLSLNQIGTKAQCWSDPLLNSFPGVSFKTNQTQTQKNTPQFNKTQTKPPGFKWK